MKSKTLDQKNKNDQRSMLRVASYNIRKAVGLDWQRNPARILHVLAEIDADIIALQEVDRRFLGKQGVFPLHTLAQHSNYTFADIADIPDSSQSHGWHGNAILYKKNTLNLISANKLKLPTLEPRGAISTLFGHASGVSFRMIGTHLSLLGHMRAKQVAAIKLHIQAAPHSCPSIIAGDFNEWRTYGKAYQAFDNTYNVITPGPSFHSAYPKLPLDRFVLKGLPQPKNVHIHLSALSLKASDHLPIVMDVDLDSLTL
jgi:endonuclease/exonuclease/phosphatase family metal-dependent hydrolase